MSGSGRITHRGIWFSAAILIAAVAVTASALVATAGSGGSSGADGPTLIDTHDAIKAAKPTWGLFSRPFVGTPVWAPDGTIYMTDCGNARIYRVTPSGKLSVFGGAGPGGFPTWQFVRHFGWASADAYSGDGRHPTDALFGCPAGLAFDATGDLFVADHLNDRIREIDTAGYVQHGRRGGPGREVGRTVDPGRRSHGG